MINQASLLIKEMNRESHSTEFWDSVWFVAVDAPYVMRKDELSEPKDAVEILQPQRFWWEIDGESIIQNLLDDQMKRIFQDKGEGLGFSIGYCMSVMAIVQSDPRCHGVPSVIMGFSQGGGLVLNLLLEAVRYWPVCGLVICSGLPNNTDELKKIYKNELTDAQRRHLSTMPVLHSHGYEDPTLFYEIGEAYYSFLRKSMKMHASEHIPFRGYHEITRHVRQSVLELLVKASRGCTYKLKTAM